MKTSRLILVFLLIFLLPCSLNAQTRENEKAIYLTEGVEQSLSLKFHFRHDEYTLDDSYRDNKSQTLELREILDENFLKHIRIDSINIYSYASPEGVYEHNVLLSKLRGTTLKELILDNLQEIENKALNNNQKNISNKGNNNNESSSLYNIESEKSKAEDIAINIFPGGENWEDFYYVLERGYWREDRQAVLAIVQSNIKNDTKKWRLQQLDGGETYKYIIYNFAYRLRQATSVFIYCKTINRVSYTKIPEINVALCDSLKLDDGEKSDLLQLKAPEARSFKEIMNTQKPKQTIFALKTNLLFDAATVLNYAIEIPIGNKLSIQFQENTPWWLTNSNKYCLQILSLGAETRFWFGNNKYQDRLNGHFFGLHIFSGTSDIQWKRNICYQTKYLCAGISYGFAFPIGKVANLEFSIAAGWARLNYQHYHPSEDFSILYRDYNDAGIMNYFGPTKAEISLVIPIKVKQGGVKND